MQQMAPPGPDYIATVPNLLRSAVSRFPDDEFLVMRERRLSFRDAERESAELAKGLLALGVGKGTRLGLLMSNRPDWAVIFLAASRIGALTITISTFYQPPELDWALQFHDIDTLIVEPRYLKNDYIQRLEASVPGLAEQRGPELFLPEHPYLRRIIVWGGCDRRWALKGPDDILAAAAPHRLSDAFLAKVEDAVVPGDPAVIICTSGSTARPKSVVHTHGVIVRTTHSFIDWIDIRPGDRSLHAMHFFWVGGLNHNLLPILHVGGALCFPDTFNAEDLFETIETERVTRLNAWTAQVAALRETAKRVGRDLSMVSGLRDPVDSITGQVIPPDRRQGSIGMTETFGMHSLNRAFSPAPVGKTGNLGRNLPSVERKIIDPASKKELGPNEVGELYVRGYIVMDGYYKKEDYEVFTRDGFFPTGDSGYIDEDGYFFFKGRLNDMIKTAGANVAPAEVEVVLNSFPEVAEAIVFGLPDEVRGEIVTAVVTAAGGSSISGEALRERLRQALSPYKVPHEFVFLDEGEIPRTVSHKPRKPELRELVAARLGRSLG